jgi:hypothetical protein
MADNESGNLPHTTTTRLNVTRLHGLSAKDEMEAESNSRRGCMRGKLPHNHRRHQHLDTAEKESREVSVLGL